MGEDDIMYTIPIHLLMHIFVNEYIIILHIVVLKIIILLFMIINNLV